LKSGYCRPFVTELGDPCSSVSSVIEKEIVRRLEALFALADLREIIVLVEKEEGEEK
jgi:hypothetical protein